MARLCPDCRRPLSPREFRTLMLDVCAACGGVWFDAGELEKAEALESTALLRIEESVAPRVEHHAHVSTDRWCPTCPQPLGRYYFAAGAPIYVDVCPACRGVWALDGDLVKMQAWIDEHRPRLPRPQAEVQADAAMALAQFTQQHEQFMARAHALTAFSALLGRHFRRGWL